MSEPLTPERRAELRRTLDVLIPARYTALTVLTAELLALLDAADERDRLAASTWHARALHAAEEGHYGAYCPVDGYVYPCPTISALDGFEVLDAVIACGHTRYGLDCALPDGHEGLHRGTQTVTWTDDGSDR